MQAIPGAADRVPLKNGFQVGLDESDGVANRTFAAVELVQPSGIDRYSIRCGGQLDTEFRMRSGLDHKLAAAAAAAAVVAGILLVWLSSSPQPSRQQGILTHQAPHCLAQTVGHLIIPSRQQRRGGNGPRFHLDGGVVVRNVQERHGAAACHRRCHDDPA